MRNVRNVFHPEEPFRFFRAVFGETDLLVLAFDDVIPLQLFGFCNFLRARIFILFALAFVLRIFQVFVESAF